MKERVWGCMAALLLTLAISGFRLLQVPERLLLSRTCSPSRRE